MFAELVSGIPDVELGLFVVTVVLVIVAVAQTILTQKNVSAANRLIELQAEPVVFIDADWEDRIVFNEQHLVVKIFIKNRGAGPARDIKFHEIKNDFLVGVEAQKFSELDIIKKGITELAPYQDMLLARLIQEGTWRKVTDPEVPFEYYTISGKKKEKSNVIPFAALATVYSGRVPRY
jgi:hypothetical protein